MRVNSIEILAITALFVNFVARDVKTETAIDFSIDNSTFVTKTSSKSKKSKISMESSIDNSTSVTKTSSKSKNSTKTQMDFWMRKMGSMQDHLINVQAIIVKDEELSGDCGPARRKSNKRYLMCGGSMLNRNYVLTSATCVHEATHIRHNVQAPLAVVIAPLKKTMQVIPVTKYLIHPNHRTNPYSSGHIKHNIAILTLSCRIDMENYQKIELPPLPMSQICSEENCIVAVFRRNGKINHVMFQMLAPDMPYSRRRKETSVRDVELHTSREYRRSEMIDGSILLERPKRKLAEPPHFIGPYESRIIFDDDPKNSTIAEQTENLTTEVTTTVLKADRHISSTVETSLQEEVSKALSEPEFADEPVKSFVVRSSKWYLPCAHTGSPVLLNRTQTALVAVPCNGRQPKSKWYYTDLFDNADWLRQFLDEPPPSGPHVPPPTAPPGNSSGCSTCIFNFFIELGCKDKGTCDKNGTILHGGNPFPNPPGQAPSNPPHPDPPNPPGQDPFDPPAQVPPNPHSQVPPNPPVQVPPNPPGQDPPNPPSQVPPNPPGQVPPNPPGQIPPNPPGQVPPNPPGQVPPNPHGQIPPNPPGQVPPNPPGQVPPNHLGQIPPNPPGQVPPIPPGQVPPISPGQVYPTPPGQVYPKPPGQVYPKPPGQVYPNPPGQTVSNPPGVLPPGEGLLTVLPRRKMPGGCTLNSVGIEVGPDCNKKYKESNIRPTYRTKSVRPISRVGKMKHLLPPNNAVGYVPQLQKPVTGRTFETFYRDYFFDKAKYPGKYNTRISAIPQNYKKPLSRHFHRERASDEIGLQNIEGDPTNWLSEFEKGLELNSEVKRELVKSRSNSN